MKINISTLVFSCSQINDDYTMSWLKIVLVVLVMRVAIEPREREEKERSFRVVHARLPLGHRKKNASGKREKPEKKRRRRRRNFFSFLLFTPGRTTIVMLTEKRIE